MTQWYSKELGDGLEAFVPRHETLQAHQAFTLANRCTGGAAVLSRYDAETNVVTVYFCPAAEVLALQLDASSCDKPVPGGGLQILAGVANDFVAHFPHQAIR